MFPYKYFIFIFFIKIYNPALDEYANKKYN